MSSNGPQNGTGDGEVKTDIITLTRFLTERQNELGNNATGDFTYGFRL
jgi:fructose-1,6-bisphosphatase I